VITFSGLSAGSLTGQSLAIMPNLDNVPSRLLGIVNSAVYRPAAPSALATPIDFGNVRVGTVLSQVLPVTNTATADGFSEGLRGVFVSATGHASGAGTTGLVAAGASSNALSVGLSALQAGPRFGTATFGFESDGTGTSAIVPNLALANQQVALSATAWNPGAASVLQTPISFGNVRVGTPLSHVANVSNTAPALFSESLRGQYVSSTGHASGAGATGLIAPGASSTALTASLNTSVAGVRSGTVTFGFESDGTGTSGITQNLALPNQQVSLSATVWRPAQPSTLVTPINFGNVRLGTALSQVASFSNTAANDGFSEGLRGRFLSATGQASGQGVSALVAPGDSSAALSVGLDTSSAGLRSGIATFGFETDGAGTSGLGVLGLASQNVQVSGSVFRLAEASPLPASVNFGTARIGSTVFLPLNVTNTSANDGFSERLNAAFSSATGNGTGSGSFTLLGPSATNQGTLRVGLNTSAVGLRTGSATFTFGSDGTGTSGIAGIAPLPGQTVALRGRVFRPAIAPEAVSPTTNIGIVHVGDQVVVPIPMSNLAATDGYSEGLDAEWTAMGSRLIGHGSVENLAPGASSQSLSLSVSTIAPGEFNTTALLTLASNGQGSSGLSTLHLEDRAFMVTGVVNSYAAPRFTDLAGDGVLTGVSSAFYTLDFGHILPGSQVESNLGVLNAAWGPSDWLAGSFAIDAPGFEFTGFDVFDHVTGGASVDGLRLRLAAMEEGVFGGRIVLQPRSRNASGFDGALDSVVVDIRGTVIPSPGALGVLGLSGLIGCRRRRRQA